MAGGEGEGFGDDGIEFSIEKVGLSEGKTLGTDRRVGGGVGFQ